MFLKSKTIRNIEDLANQLLAKYHIDNPSVPVDIIAENTGLTIMPYDLGDNVSGVLVINNDIGVIGYNPKDPKVRRRFTIAHELGHYLLHKEESNDLFVDRSFIVKFRDNSKAYNEKEIRHEHEANAFAAALLMPTFLIEKELAKSDFDELSEVEVITELAKLFDVSAAAMTYRLSNMNLFSLY